MTKLVQDTESDAAVAALLEAYRTGQPIDDLPPASRPATLAQARHIQERLVDALGGRGGWKVGKMQPGVGAGCSPIPRDRVLASPARWQWPASPIVEIEVELAFSFGKDLAHGVTAGGPLGVDDVRDAIAAMHPALEVATSRFVNKAGLPTLTTTADLQSNAGLVFGPAITDWTSIDLASLALELSYNGDVVARTDNGAPQAAVLESLTWLANHARSMGKPIRAGEVVLTGARIGPIPVTRGVHVRAHIERLGSVEISM